MSMIESTLQLKPYGVILKITLQEDFNLPDLNIKDKLNFKLIFNALESTRYINMVPKVSYPPFKNLPIVLQ